MAKRQPFLLIHICAGETAPVVVEKFYREPRLVSCERLDLDDSFKATKFCDKPHSSPTVPERHLLYHKLIQAIKEDFSEIPTYLQTTSAPKPTTLLTPLDCTFSSDATTANIASNASGIIRMTHVCLL